MDFRFSQDLHLLENFRSAFYFSMFIQYNIDKITAYSKKKYKKVLYEEFNYNYINLF